MALSAPLWPSNPAALDTAFVFCVWGLLREQAQHRDKGWIDCWNVHRVLEGLAWGVGAGILMGICNTVS